ncbi:MAG TPA: OadG-related small transporter subunit [Treponemataceae bacterium]|jgi:Na+-transporting methylmalonyl-CoA/oxaloacetate decarboxylase gamma subunit|nr:OadG-related small transporter subunit [Treponemataceae bacterium]HOQ92221.1 OadG-related small transporter subunit [Treponemataceae bacterium]HPM05429.1 OadG-related small transporter subunit [Treponemataceae bacterium]HPY52394.1 OadG-related small transporter subunit [Treponemataceae bacterium]HQC26477.1 OadG-related small transporter subunit [Treponemataceae bacterium]
MDFLALQKSFLLMGIGMAVLFVFMGILILVVDLTVKVFRKKDIQ